MALTDYMANNTPAGFGMTPPPARPVSRSGTDIVKSSLEAMLDPNSSYIKNARQRGMEVAAERGGLNSSIAAGASERAAIDAVQPLVQQAVGLEAQRTSVEEQDWLNAQGFNREFQGTLAMLPLNNSMNMLNAVTNYSLQDPELYGPDVISGYSNFFNQNMKDLISNYFGGG